MADNFLRVYKGLTFSPRTEDPANPAEGDVYFADGSFRDKGLWEYFEGNWQRVGGSGDANELQNRLVIEVNQSLYQRVTPNIFAVTEEELVDVPETDATWSSIDKAYEIALNEKVTSLNLLTREILNKYNTDITAIRLDAYWAPAFVDEGALYEVSRDGGANWQVIDMERIDLSDSVTGELIFENELTNAFTQSIGLANSFALFSTVKSVPFTLADPTTLKQINLAIQVNNTPFGAIIIEVVADDMGSPSSLAKDIYFTRTVQLPGLVSGLLELEGTIPLPEGDFHIVLTPDSTYSTELVNSSNANSINVEVDALSELVIDLEGRVKDVRVRVTGSAQEGLLKGYGLFWKKRSEVKFLDNQEFNYSVRFLSNTDNTNEFTLPWLPSPTLLQVYNVYTGQVWKFGAFSLQGNKVIFPQDTFGGTAQDEIVFLRFSQVQNSGTIDASDANSALLAANHLGSTDGQIDRSIAGRGIFLRAGNGELREVALDETGTNLEIWTVD